MCLWILLEFIVHGEPMPIYLLYISFLWWTYAQIILEFIVHGKPMPIYVSDISFLWWTYAQILLEFIVHGATYAHLFIRYR